MNNEPKPHLSSAQDLLPAAARLVKHSHELSFLIEKAARKSDSSPRFSREFHEIAYDLRKIASELDIYALRFARK